MRVKPVEVFIAFVGVLACLCSPALAAPPTYTISGVVATADGTGVEGIDVAGDNGATSAVTAADGSYSITVSNHWDGTVTVSRTGWLITPPSNTYTNVSADVADQNYTAYQPKISGYVTKPDGTPLVGSTVTTNNGGGSDVTDTSGYYEFYVPYNWSGIVIVSMNKWSFDVHEYSTVQTDVQQNYIGTYLYGGGSGVNEDPYQIWDVNDLIAMSITSADWDKSFILMDDLDMTGYVFAQAVIAPDIDNSSPYFQGIKFTGVLDGYHHVISNLTIVATDKDYIGLIGYVDSNGQIKNLDLENINIKGRRYIGGLAGHSRYIVVTNCSSIGSVIGTSYDVGGLVGRSEYGVLATCSTNGSVSSGASGAGGIVGSSNWGIFVSCFSNSSVNGTFNYIGGLVGLTYQEVITNCYSTGSVSGTGDFIGGLTGYSDHSTLTTCYTTGSVDGGDFAVGGLVGQNWYGIITNSYSTNWVNGSSCVGGLVGRSYCLRADRKKIVNCYSTANVTGSASVGGLIGESTCFNVTNCYATGTVIGRGGVGGLIGDAWNSLVLECCATGNIHKGSGTSSSHYGGLIGYLGSSSSVEGSYVRNCFALGDVSGTTGVGGLIGSISDELALVENSYAVGKTTTNVLYSSGGLIGYYYSGNISGCFWDTVNSGSTVAYYVVPAIPVYSTLGVVEGKTTGEMQMLSTFTTWDFVGESVNGENEIWRMCVDGVDYPRLSWEFAKNGDFACPDGIGIDDLESLAMNWLTAASADEATFNYACDANGDEVINLVDYGILAENWLVGIE